MNQNISHLFRSPSLHVWCLTFLCQPLSRWVKDSQSLWFLATWWSYFKLKNAPRLTVSVTSGCWETTQWYHSLTGWERIIDLNFTGKEVFFQAFHRSIKTYHCPYFPPLPQLPIIPTTANNFHHCWSFSPLPIIPTTAHTSTTAHNSHYSPYFHHCP